MRRKQSPLTLRGKNLNIPCCSSKSALSLLKFTYCQCIWTVMKKPKCQHKGIKPHLTAFCAFGLSWPGGPTWHSLVLQSRNVRCSAGTEAEGLTPRPVTVPEKELQLNSRLTEDLCEPSLGLLSVVCLTRQPLESICPLFTSAHSRSESWIFFMP